MQNPPKHIDIWTVQVALHRAVKAKGIHFLDITVMSGVKAFAPEWWALRMYKAGDMPEEEYTALYKERMLQTQSRAPGQWGKLTDHPSVAFACYCKAGDYCHRHIFKHLAEDFIKARGMQVTQRGEFTKEKK